MRVVVIVVAAATLSMLVGCERRSEEGWTTTFAESPDSLQRLGGDRCDLSSPRHHPPASAPALTETEALEYVGRIIDGPRCVSPAERRRIARDTAALRLYAEHLSGVHVHADVDPNAALLWLATSDDPRPWAAVFFTYAVVDSFDTTRRAWWPAALGLLRLAPDNAAARERLRTLARQGSKSQRWAFARLLVEANDSAARALLREHAPDLASGASADSRMLRDIASVLAAPPPRPAETGPCFDRRDLGRSAEGAFTCLAPGPGVRVLPNRRYRQVAHFDRRPGRGQRRGEFIVVAANGPGFLTRDAQVMVDMRAEGSNRSFLFVIDPDSLLHMLHHQHGGPVRVSEIRDSLVIPVYVEAPGETLVLRRDGAASRTFDVVFASPVMANAPVQTGRIRFTRTDADRFVDALRDAARVARQLQAAGVEDSVSKGSR